MEARREERLWWVALAGAHGLGETWALNLGLPNQVAPLDI